MKRLIFLLTILIFIWQTITYAQFISNSPETDSLIAVGMDQIHRLETDSALVTFSALTEIYPEDPIGYFYLAAIYDLVNQNYRITTFEKEFKKEVDLAIKKGEKFIKKNKKNPLGFFYLGGAYGIKGLHEVKKRQWFKAFVDGIKGLNHLRKSLAIREDFYDAYFGLGMYHYWRSAMTRKLFFLRGFSDQRQQGINELNWVIEKGKYATVESQFGIVTCYYNEAMYDSALAINSDLYSKFPYDPSVLYLRAKIFEKTERWQDLYGTSQDLYKLLTDYEHQSMGYLVECHYLMALAMHNLNKNEEALQHLETAMILKEKRNKKQELEGPLDDFNDVFKNAKKLHKKLKSP